jgi:hypothetical protein
MTDRQPFEPIGEQARWKTVYDILVAAPVNGIVTYRTLGDALDLHPDNDRNAIQVAMRKAAWEHEQMDKRAVDNMPNIGYRVVETAERPMLARRQQKRSSRALVRGHSKAANIDLNGVEPQVRHALEMIAQAFALQMDFNRRFDVRQNRLEDAIRQISDTQAMDRKRTEEEVAALRDRLARLESDNKD